MLPIIGRKNQKGHFVRDGVNPIKKNNEAYNLQSDTEFWNCLLTLVAHNKKSDSDSRSGRPPGLVGARGQ